GAKISFSNGAMTQSQEMIAGGRYLLCDDPMRVFAAANNWTNQMISVRWRNGAVSTITNVLPNQLYEVEQQAAEIVQGPKSKVQSPAAVFKDVSALLGHQHRE